MGNYAGNNDFGANITTHEVSTPVLGGESGNSNIPLKQLADRTAYLKERVQKITTITDISYQMLSEDLFVEVFGSSLYTITLPTIGVADVGRPYYIKMRGLGQVDITSADANIDGVDDDLNLIQDDYVSLIFNGTDWSVINSSI